MNWRYVGISWWQVFFGAQNGQVFLIIVSQRMQPFQNLFDYFICVYSTFESFSASRKSIVILDSLLGHSDPPAERTGWWRFPFPYTGYEKQFPISALILLYSFSLSSSTPNTNSLVSQISFVNQQYHIQCQFLPNFPYWRLCRLS